MGETQELFGFEMSSLCAMCKRLDQKCCPANKHGQLLGPGGRVKGEKLYYKCCFDHEAPRRARWVLNKRRRV